jgi:hypothetical protein
MMTKTLKPRIWFDSDTNAYRATAPTGYRFEESLHELVEPCGITWARPSAADKRETKKAIEARVAASGPLEKCDDDHCGWCVQ